MLCGTKRIPERYEFRCCAAGKATQVICDKFFSRADAVEYGRKLKEAMKFNQVFVRRV